MPSKITHCPQSVRLSTVEVAETQDAPSPLTHQQRIPQKLLSNSSLSLFCESIFSILYRVLIVGLHFCLAVAFLALVAVWVLGSFHDNYFVTILHRARRTDNDLREEITYYHRQCTIMDVTIRTSLDDDPSELFIALPSPSDDDDDDDDNNDEESGDTDRVFKFQHRRQKKRRRRRFVPPFRSWESSKLPPISKSAAKKSGTRAVDTMMKHGSVMVQQILSETTIRELREFLLQKNERVFGTLAEYPLSQSHHRISYGIEAAEHESVIRALKEIHDHPVFAHLITNLVGDDNPALSEITAITVWAGADDQGWHPDVKPDGNGVKFGRTYSHSYSLFLPLQNTHEDMGPTDLCPGTHYCADEDIWDVCDANRIGLNDVRPRYTGERNENDDQYEYSDDGDEGVWVAGDGVLLNQQVWHRGKAHVDEEGNLDRVVFIVSFLKRPVADDPRQLARGTYFHQYWSNWFATWQDMKDAGSSMQWPWNILRCLHLWKPSDREWGYDLFTATSLRIANSQMGGQPSDLKSLIENVMIPLKFPKWLQGTIDFQSDFAWQIYLQETIRNTYVYLIRINYILHLGFILFLLTVVSISYLYNHVVKQRSQQQHLALRSVLQGNAWRLGGTHGFVFVMGLFIWYKIRSSKWATDIDSGTTLMRPFPPQFINNDHSVKGGSTTLPRRSDVLIGTRYNTRSIGEYRKWLDYHPGNRIFDKFAALHSGAFYRQSLQASKNQIDKIDDSNDTTFLSSLPELLSSSALEMMKKHGGRFLMQDYRTGNWKVMSDDESKSYVQTRLFIGYGTVLESLKEEIDILLDKYRFGVSRKTRSMSWNSQLYLADLSGQLFTPASFLKRKVTTSTGASSLSSGAFLSSMVSPKSFLSKLQRSDLTLTNSLDALYAGTEIYYIDDNEDDFHLYPGIIVGISVDENNEDDDAKDDYARYDIALYYEGVQALGMIEQHNVPLKLLLIRQPIIEGSRVEVRYGGNDHGDDDYDDDNETARNFIEGVVLLVSADGAINVKFDHDGSEITNIPVSEYNLLPTS